MVSFSTKILFILCMIGFNSLGPVRTFCSTTDDDFFLFQSLSNKRHQLTIKLLRKFILIIFFLVIFVGCSFFEVFSKRFLYLENKTMKIKNRNKVDTSPISCNYYTMLIEKSELIILLLSVCKTFSLISGTKQQNFESRRVIILKNVFSSNILIE